MLNNLKSNSIRIFFLALFTCFISSNAAFAAAKNSFFQLKVYHFQTDAQELVIDDYLEKAYLPAMHKLGFDKIAVFKPIENKNKTEKLIYVFTSASKLERFATLDVDLLKDNAYLEAGKAYLDAAHNNPPYSRVEVILMKAFEGMPFATVPKLNSDKSQRVYELRSYEGPTEKLAANKVSMFNNGEIDIFKKLNFNAVFYGQVIAGSTMPNLIYLTCFENMDDRDAHWKAFGPLYKPMSDMPQYQNNVSKNVTTLCTVATYSDM